MKKQDFIVFLVLVLTTTAFINPNESKYLEKYGFRKIPAGLLENHPEKIAIASFYMFETEVTNREYAEFLNDLLKMDRPDDYYTCKIDSLGWNKVLHFENSYPRDYHLTAEFADYPVVNISYEAANLFCDWLEHRLSDKIPNIDIRLPEKNEWIYAARGGKPDALYPWENIQTGEKRDFEMCNYNSPKDGTCLATNYAKSYYANAYGLYNMSGNVAEMLNGKGNTAGGSWNSSILQMKITADDEYRGIDPPSSYIGFRPVAVIK